MAFLLDLPWSQPSGEGVTGSQHLSALTHRLSASQPVSPLASTCASGSCSEMCKQNAILAKCISETFCFHNSRQSLSASQSCFLPIKPWLCFLSQNASLPGSDRGRKAYLVQALLAKSVCPLTYYHFFPMNKMEVNFNQSIHILILYLKSTPNPPTNFSALQTLIIFFSSTSFSLFHLISCF